MLKSRDLKPALDLLVKCFEEMSRQDDTWGWPPLTSAYPKDDPITAVFDKLDSVAREMNDNGRASWPSVIVEKLAEAILEDDPECKIQELIETATCCLSWAQVIRESMLGRGMTYERGRERDDPKQEKTLK